MTPEAKARQLIDQNLELAGCLLQDLKQLKLARFKQQGKPPPKGWQEKYPNPVFPDATSLLALPEGWVWSCLRQCFHIEAGATPSRKEPSYWCENISWVSSGGVGFSRTTSTKEQISELGLNNSRTQINLVGGVLRDGSFSRANKRPRAWKELTC